MNGLKNSFSLEARSYKGWFAGHQRELLSPQGCLTLLAEEEEEEEEIIVF